MNNYKYYEAQGNHIQLKCRPRLRFVDKHQLILGILCVFQTFVILVLYSHNTSTRQYVATDISSDRLKMLASHNLPLKRSYRNAKGSFKDDVPKSLEGWFPRKDSYLHFQPVSGFDAWIYSAFWEVEDNGVETIRIFGMMRGNISPKVHCYLHFDGVMQEISLVEGQSYKFPDDHKTRVFPVVTICPVYREDGVRPKFVSITPTNNSNVNNRLQIIYPGTRKRKFTVCYSPFHSYFDETHRLVHSIQYNIAMGAEHFMVYNFSLSTAMDRLIRHYEARGLVTVQQWPLPTLETWYLGQMISINDCLYRNKGISEFVTFVDTDEIIVPRLHNSWAEMIEDIELDVKRNGTRFLSKKKSVFNATKDSASYDTGDQAMLSEYINAKSEFEVLPMKRKLLAKRKKPKHKDVKWSYTDRHFEYNYKLQTNFTQLGSFTIMSAFFISNHTYEWSKIRKHHCICSSEERFFMQHDVYPFLQFYRNDATFRHGFRSKYIVKTELTSLVGIHFVTRHKGNATDFPVNDETVVAHHYRFEPIGDAGRVDTSAFRFKNLVGKRLREEFSRLKLNNL